MNAYTVKLLKPGKGTEITYEGFELLREPNHLLIHARWDRDTLDLGYTTFQTGDHFYEHYYTDKWFNIFEIRSERGRLKGWYCNVTKPARVEGLSVLSEDLELDLFVSADRQEVVTLDEEEFEAREFSQEVRQAALNGLGGTARDGTFSYPAFQQYNLSVEFEYISKLVKAFYIDITFAPCYDTRNEVCPAPRQPIQ